MSLLTKEEITSDLAETILDKVHLGMTKQNPLWQEWAMEEDSEPWKEGQLNELSRKSFLTVLRSSDKKISKDGCLALAREFKKLGADFLSDFLKEKADVTDEEGELNAEKSKQTEKSVCVGSISNVLKSNPTQAQLRAGNYKKNHVRIHGLDIAIENKKGSYRSGEDKDGKAWKTKIRNDYGYIRRTTGADGDHVDVFLGPDNESELVFVINQKNKDQSFDEYKVMIGFHDQKAAKTAYLSNYEKGWKGFGSIVPLTISQFKEWLRVGKTKKELKNPKIEFLKSRLALISNNDSLENNIHREKEETRLPIQKAYLTLFDSKRIENQTSKEILKNSLSVLKDCLPRLERILKAQIGRNADPINTTSVWSDGLTHIKKEEGWRVLPKGRQKREFVPQNTPRKKEAKEETPKKGDSVPTTLPFNKLRVIKQYTDKENYDRNQIDSLKALIFQNGYDPGFPMAVDLKDDQWTVVAGHHRYEAIKELIGEGKLPDNFTVHVVPKSFQTSNDRLVAQVSENHRRSVNPTDESKAYAEMQKNGWDTKTIAEKLGKKVGEIDKRLALNNLCPDLFKLISKKDRSLPLGVAEVIGMFGKDSNDKPNQTIQIKAFKWYVENKSKYPGKGPSVVQNYIKELLSGEFDNFSFEQVATSVQKEALRSIGSMEKAATNRKMLNTMLDTLQKTYNRILGDNVSALSPEFSKELAASIAVAEDKGVGSSAMIGRLSTIIQDLSIIKNSIQSKLKEIEDDSSIGLLFDAPNRAESQNDPSKSNKEDYLYPIAS
ncbi:ParB N-terminal domain-containing protein [Leptospira sp. FAT2]|uniref:ParB N-terminal domain-containing protein n=1 Tax=Leptospira sanjuanensis TaxID=2879643 RepID=UPI001EE95A7E|nr:ParB N-terminal domain-containing protein [Leptospira sanjuanensis]MCG6195644.1 ParB N-terminal domain-containing protein [Leptospira sanjuanensis]